MRCWPVRLLYRCMTVCETDFCVLTAGWLIWNHTFAGQKLTSSTMLPQVSPWLDGMYWISLERDSPLLRVAFRKRVNSLTWSLLRASKSVMQGKLNRAKEEGFIFPLMIHRAALAIPAVIPGTWTWTGVGLSLTSNDYNILESDRQNPKRCHYGQKKCNRKTEKHSQIERKGKQSILHILTEVCNRTKPDTYTPKKERKWNKRKYTSTQRNHRKPCDYTERSPPSLQTIYFSLTEICQCLTTILSSTHSCKLEAQHL